MDILRVKVKSNSDLEHEINKMFDYERSFREVRTNYTRSLREKELAHIYQRINEMIYFKMGG